jgi:tight adherence protein B
VTENGAPVHALSVQSGNAVGQSHFATVLLIANGFSMRGTRIQAALQAARSFLAVRDRQQPVGIVFFNAVPVVTAPITTDSGKLDKALATTPTLGPGRHIFDGAAAALQMLREAGIEHGTILLLSDGQDTGSKTTQQAVAGAALAQGVRFYGIGVLAPFQGSTLHSLAGATQGVYRTVASGDLVGLYQRLAAELANQYTIRYEAVARLGHAVTVSVSVPGAGVATAGYTAPVPGALPAAPPRHSSFITSDTFAGLVVGVGALLIGLGAFMLSRQRQAVSTRVGSFLGPRRADYEAPRSLVERALGDPRARSLGRSPYWRTLVEEMDVGELTIPPEQLVLGTAVVTVCLGFLLSRATGSPIATLLALLVPFGVFLAIRANADRKRRMFDDQLPDNLQVVASSMRAGNTFVAALNVVVQDAADPSRRELRRAMTDEQLGIPLADALGGVTKRMKSEDFQHVAVVATLQRDTGGNTAEVVDLVAETVRERIELRRMVSALTAQGRLAGGMLSLLPGAILAIVSVINPHYVHPLFHRSIGLIALGVGAGMVVTGAYLIRRIVNIEV